MVPARLDRHDGRDDRRRSRPRRAIPHALGELGDEQVYASNACWYAHSSKAICGLAREGNLEHPPLGKWIMSLPMNIWGYTPFSQRILSVVFGTLTVALLYLLARFLLRSTVGATIASGGLAIDFMAIVHSRVAMLDVYLLFFVVLAFVFLVLDRNQLFDKGRSGGSRPWRLAAGAAAGAAIATKWTGLLTLFAIAFLSFAWEDSRRRDRKSHLLVTLAEQGPSLFLAFVLVPLVVYATTFVGHIRGALMSWPWTEGSWLNALWERQAHIFRFHAQLIWEHQSSSPPWSWPLAKRGAPFIYTPGDSIRTVVDTGNPVIWTLSIVVIDLHRLQVGPPAGPSRARRCTSGRIPVGVSTVARLFPRALHLLHVGPFGALHLVPDARLAVHVHGFGIRRDGTGP